MHYNHHHNHHQKVLSTGVLTREPDTVCAVVNILNPDHYDHHVKVEVWDWSSYDRPVLLPVYIGDPPKPVIRLEIEENQLAVLYADLQASRTELYEIRFYLCGHGNLLINCFGRSAQYASQTGNTVLNNDLIELGRF